MLRQPLMTVHETAEMLKVKESTVRAWIRQCKLRAIKFGREWRVTVVDLETFLNQNANFEAPRSVNGPAPDSEAQRAD